MANAEAGIEPPGRGVSTSKRLPTPFALLAGALHTRRGQVGLGIVLFVLAGVIIGPIAAPDPPTAILTVPFGSPNGHYLLGSDVIGRDVLSRLLNGGWELLLMAAIATTLGVGLGAAIGIVAAFKGRAVDGVLMRTMDVLLAFPQIVLALLLVSVVGPKVWLIVLAVAAAHMPQVARVIRAAALDVCERDFVKNAALIGVPSWRVVGGDILPNLISPLMVEAGLRFSYSIILMAGLSFLGFGLQPPSPNWGAMMNENRIGLYSNPWAVIAPAVLLATLTVGVNVLTDAIARASVAADRPGASPSDDRVALLELGEVSADAF